MMRHTMLIRTIMLAFIMGVLSQISNGVLRASDSGHGGQLWDLEPGDWVEAVFGNGTSKYRFTIVEGPAVAPITDDLCAYIYGIEGKIINQYTTIPLPDAKILAAIGRCDTDDYDEDDIDYGYVDTDTGSSPERVEVQYDGSAKLYSSMGTETGYWTVTSN